MNGGLGFEKVVHFGKDWDYSTTTSAGSDVTLRSSLTATLTVYSLFLVIRKRLSTKKFFGWWLNVSTG